MPTRKTFEWMAAGIREVPAGKRRNELIKAAILIGKKNPRFDENRFRSACNP
jgi:hypothetical protein